MTIREELERREIENLSPHAMRSVDSRGRKVDEPPCDIRPVFQRDRDRILHSKAFRRLKQKTQVFLLPDGDHYRTRLTHTLEVSQNARTIAKALCLNEDLTEAIALGHDLGHTPFGHAGERALDQMSPYGFSHNQQSVRVATRIEKNGQGLNLTWEVLDGILNHKFSGTPHTLEGQIVRLSDKIAYLNHDIDDAIRGGIISEEMIPLKFRKGFGDSVKKWLDTMIHDVITCSMDQDKIDMSPDKKALMMELKDYLFQNVYQNDITKKQDEKAIHMIQNLYRFYRENPEFIPEGYRQKVLRNGKFSEQIICDYIAGMTDNYAIQKFQEYYIPKSWKL